VATSWRNTLSEGVKVLPSHHTVGDADTDEHQQLERQ
jgi:hypothetical protein